MRKDYKVLERSFINGKLCEVGDIVTLHIDNPGTNLQLVKPVAEPATPAPPSGGTGTTGAGDSSPPVTKGIEAYHVGAGRWAIKDGSGERIGDWVGSREEAEAKAAGMNAVDPDLDDQDDGSLPDA